MKYSEEEHKHVYFVNKFYQCQKITELIRLIKMKTGKSAHEFSEYIKNEDNFNEIIKSNLFNLPFIRPNFLKRLSMKQYDYDRDFFIKCLNELRSVLLSDRFKELKDDVYTYCRVTISDYDQQSAGIIFDDEYKYRYDERSFNWNNFNSWITEYNKSI